MTADLVRGQAFPRKFRLRSKKDFRLSGKQKFVTTFFTFLYSRQGKGRLGISVAKKVLHNAVSRNRVKRLIREAFRKDRKSLIGIDLHVIARASVKTVWEHWKLKDVQKEFTRLHSKI